MTALWRRDAPEEPIKAWIRAQDGLDSRDECVYICDSDLWVQRYGRRKTKWAGVDREVQYVMLVEIKTFGRDLDTGQRDLLSIVNDLLRTKTLGEQRTGGMFVAGHLQNARRVHSWIAGKRVEVHCYGVHKLRLSGSTPDDSDRITWDKRPVSREELVLILRFDLNPDDPSRRIEHRSHKKTIDDPSLFSDEAT